jgi:cyclase
MRVSPTRIIPVLLCSDGQLVKTRKFRDPVYVGDPLNAAVMFDELKVDELLLLDIRASKEAIGVDYNLVKQIANFCSMPLGYGGGINSCSEAEEVIKLGVEKISINSALFSNPKLISEISKNLGSQAVMASIDLSRDPSGRPRVWFSASKKFLEVSPLDFALTLQDLGAGEILITSIDREGTWTGPDIELVSEISAKLEIPTILNGGVSSPVDIESVFTSTDCSAVGVSSLFLFNGPGQGVAIGVPDELSKRGKL